MKTNNDKTNPALGPIIEIALSLIDFDPRNRKEHDGPALKSLAASIQAEGLQNPVVVRAHPQKPGRYMLVSGERRTRAFLLNKAAAIPARVADTPEAGAARKRLIENMQREDLTPIEEARGYRELAVDHKMTQKEIAELAGVAQPTVANALRLLDLPAEVQQLIQEGKLTRAHGVALARWSEWPKICQAIASYAVKQRASSKQLEDGGLPFYWELERAGLVARIKTQAYDWEREPAYTLNDTIKKECACVEVSRDSWYSFAPDKWVLVKKAQDDIREQKKAEAAKKSASGKKGAKTKEQLERAKKLAKNKAARQQLAASLDKVKQRLVSAKAMDPRALALVCKRAASASSADVEEEAKVMGIPLPKGFDGWSAASWAKLKPALAVNLAAFALAAAATAEAMRSAGMVPDTVNFLSGKGGGR